ncbi:MAG: response regulator [Mycetocola sp.]
MIRILLLDDHPVVRHGMRALLATQPDFEVVAEASSAAEAVELTRVGRLDVILADLDLGDRERDGIAATEAVLQVDPAVRVIIFSAFDADADIVRAIDAGAAGYLVKDTEPAQIFGAIRDAARGTAALGGPVAAMLLDRMQHPQDALTARELAVLTLAAEGLSNRDLAARLFVSEATVKTHLHRVFTKLDVTNRQAAITAGVARGLIRL